jgi:hypothetical protein
MTSNAASIGVRGQRFGHESDSILEVIQNTGGRGDMASRRRGALRLGVALALLAVTACGGAGPAGQKDGAHIGLVPGVSLAAGT